MIHDYIQKIHANVSVLDIEDQHLYEKTLQRELPNLTKSYLAIPVDQREKVKEETMKSLSEIHNRLHTLYEKVVIYYLDEHKKITNRIKA